MELVQVGERTYYIKNPTNIGIYKLNDKEVYLIDAGNDKDAGRKILKICDAQGWTVKCIIATHSNADHIGGCKFIQDRAKCPVYAHGAERSFTEFPILEPSFLYGANPIKELQNKFLMAKGCEVTELEGNLPEGLELISLKGHYFDMVGVKTVDGVCFLADSLFSAETIEKYHLFFIYDVRDYLGTLDMLAGLEGRLFIPSHCEAAEDISALIERNREKVLEVAEKIYSFCAGGNCFEDILKAVFDEYSLAMNPGQYVLIGSTVRSYLTYLYEDERVGFEFRDNKMYWLQK